MISVNLQDIPSELIRENWSIYKNTIKTDDPYYTNSFKSKFRFNFTIYYIS